MKMRMTKHRQRETVRERDQHHLPNIRVADLRHRTPRVLPHTTSPHQPFPALLAPLGCLARMRCCIKRTRLVRRVDASALNLALPFGEEAVDALQPVLQFPETRTRELEEGRHNTGDRELYRVSAGRLTRHHHCEVCGGDLQRTA